MTQTSLSPASRDERHALLHRIAERLDDLPHLPELRGERFQETHQLFEARSDQQRRILAWFGEAAAEWCRADAAGQPYRVLSVGSGAGLADVPIARHLAGRSRPIAYTGIDPNEVQCATFQRRFDEAGLPDASLEVFAGTFDDFAGQGPFDLIHFVQSAYYLPDVAASMQRARALLAPGGRLVVVHAPCEEMNQLATLFYDRFYGRPTLFAQDLAQLMGGLGWQVHRSRLDASLRMDPTGAEADSLRDFIIQADGRALPGGLLSMVERYLQVVTLRDGAAAWIPHPVDFFVIEG